MAGFQFYSQPQGPQIDLDLFPKAAAQGVETGKALGTPFSNAVAGAEQGVSTGLKWNQEQAQTDETQAQTAGINTENEVRKQQVVTAQLNNQLKQNDVDNIDNDNKQIEAKTTIAQNDAKVSSMNTDTAVLTDQDRSATAVSQAAQNLQATQQAAQDKENLKTINGLISSGDEDDVQQVLTTPELTDTLSRNPTEANTLMGRIVKNENYSEDARNQAGGFAGGIREQQWQSQEQRSKDRQATAILKQEELDNSKGTGYRNRLAGTLSINAGYAGGADGLTPNLVNSYQVTIRLQNGVDVQGLQPYELKQNGKHVAFLDKAEGEKFAQDQSAYNTVRGAYSLPSTNPQNPPPQQGAPGIGSISGPTGSATPNATPANTPVATDSPKDAALRAKVAQQFTQKAAAVPTTSPQGVFDTMRQKNQAANGTPPQPAAGPSKTSYSSPSDAYSKNMFQRVSFAPGDNHGPKQSAVDVVNSNPYLQNTPPLIKGVATVESGGRTNAQSPTGVNGLMQVTQAVAKSYGLNRDDPKQNVLAGQLYLHDLTTRFNYHLPLALAAYNAGPGTVGDSVKRTGSTDWNVVKQDLKEHLSPSKYAEVEHYPEKVIAATGHYLGNDPSTDQGTIGMVERSGMLSRKPNPDMIDA